ncbi:hypothetical protein Ahy_A08g038954 isoform D [Arachis hypogaea]|uniref:Uncharacterized protein n=1 Tax=Arachis hypogaea TaxID=3818 RepID=A0A445BV40_ARAHY|nr:hypothetical protein Ahy_A08g038954 isoform D [Arachis hypogaea]
MDAMAATFTDEPKQQGILDQAIATSPQAFSRLGALGGLLHNCKHHFSQEDVLSLHIQELDTCITRCQ